MKNSSFKVILLGSLLILIGVGCGSDKTAGTITFDQGSMIPQTITIKAGEGIEFENNDTEAHAPASDSHPEHNIYPEFDSGRGIEPGNSWVFVFEKKGRWKYHDHLNGNNSNFFGTIIVE